MHMRATLRLTVTTDSQQLPGIFLNHATFLKLTPGERFNALAGALLLVTPASAAGIEPEADRT